MRTKSIARSMVTLLAATLTLTAAPLAGAAPAPPGTDGFYRYDGTAPLESYAPGTVLKTRTTSYNVVNVPTPLQAVQILYRSTDALGRPVANVTSVLRPANALPGKVVSYQSFYDSLNPEDSPSRAIAGNTPLGGWTVDGRNLEIGGAVASSEAFVFGPLLAMGYTVVIPDTEGPNADFAAGPEYGMTTLDSLRAVRAVPETGVTVGTDIGLMGYSGGAIATNWAAILAPSYAPEIDADLVGAAQGGVLVDPAKNLRYASGSIGWGGVVGMAVVGVARSYGIDFDRYLNDRGREVVGRLADASIGNVIAQYPGLTWEQMVKPGYEDPNSIPEYVDAVNKINMGLAPVPTIPMFIGQGANGVLEGTPPGGPGIGPGDGIMVAGDVRGLAHRYCDAGLTVQYDEYAALSHVPAAVAWLPGAVIWLHDRLSGVAATGNCGQFAPGNSFAPARPATG
ncbi:lipase family protein [Prescottella sp. R16]|uniref:lipase family protein n=1 Tax=Prescottella sp. R16 TaxID=3064529 RepID=UPI00272EB7A4|nr:lipase family protein [Prescottella sp. R16]